MGVVIYSFSKIAFFLHFSKEYMFLSKIIVYMYYLKYSIFSLEEYFL